MANLKDLYKNEVAPKLREKLGLDNPMLVPRMTKIVFNMGFAIVEKDVQKARRARACPTSSCAKAWSSAPR